MADRKKLLREAQVAMDEAIAMMKNNKYNTPEDVKKSAVNTERAARTMAGWIKVMAELMLDEPPYIPPGSPYKN